MMECWRFSRSCSAAGSAAKVSVNVKAVSFSRFSSSSFFSVTTRSWCGSILVLLAGYRALTTRCSEPGMITAVCICYAQCAGSLSLIRYAAWLPVVSAFARSVRARGILGTLLRDLPRRSSLRPIPTARIRTASPRRHRRTLGSSLRRHSLRNPARHNTALEATACRRCCLEFGSHSWLYFCSRRASAWSFGDFDHRAFRASAIRAARRLRSAALKFFRPPFPAAAKSAAGLIAPPQCGHLVFTGRQSSCFRSSG